MENETVDAKSEKKQGFLTSFLNETKNIRYDTIRESQKAINKFIIYIIYLILTLVVTQRSSQAVQFFYNDAVQRSLASEFTEIYNQDHYWNFLKFSFLPLLQLGDFQPSDPASVYKHVNETWEFDEIYGNVFNRTLLHGNILLGSPRLRQIRVPHRSCNRKSIFTRSQVECFGTYKWYNEDKRDYQGYKWLGLYEDKSLPIWGRVEIYLGAGYVVSLSHNKEENLGLIDRLMAQKWLDHRTALVALEFSLYHVNTRLFHTAKFMAEQTFSRIYVPSIQLQSIRRESFLTEGSFVISTIILYYILIINIAAREIKNIRKIGFRTYLSYVMNIIDFMACTFSILLLTLNVAHSFCVTGIVKQMKTSNQYINLDVLHLIHIISKNISGLLMFLVCIRFLCFYTFNRTLVIFWTVLQKSQVDVLGFLLLFIPLVMAYASCGQLLFGGEAEHFRKGFTSVMTMLRWTVGDFKQAPVSIEITMQIYFLSFIILVYIILSLCFKAIIINTFLKVNKVVGQRSCRLTDAIYLYFRDFYDWLYWLILRKQKVRPYLDIDARQEVQTTDDLLQDTAEAAVKLKDPPLLTQDEYLPKRLERARKLVDVLEEVTPPVLGRLLEYYNMLHRRQGHLEMNVIASRQRRNMAS